MQLDTFEAGVHMMHLALEMKFSEHHDRDKVSIQRKFRIYKQSVFKHLSQYPHSVHILKCTYKCHSR